MFANQYAEIEEQIKNSESRKDIVQKNAGLRAISESIDSHQGGSWEERRNPTRVFQRAAGDFRIVCLSTTKASLSMWAHYAENHCGAVVELQRYTTQSKKGWGLWVGSAREVKYDNNRPVISTVDGLIEFEMNPNEKIGTELLIEYLFRKSEQWVDEQEWRIVSSQTEPDDLNTFLELQEGDVSAVYLGCRISKIDKERIISLCRNRTPRIRVVQMKQDPKNYQLIEEEVEVIGFNG
jgi:hypothetical protein